MNTTAIRHMLIAQRAQIDAALAQLEEPAKAEWLTVREAADRLGKSVDAVRSMARSGVIESRTTEGGGKMWVRVAG